MEKCKQIWQAALHWSGWKKLLFPHSFVVLLLTAVTLVGLPRIFVTGQETTLAAYLLYPVSAYTLVILCAWLPKFVRWVKKHFARDPVAQKLVIMEKDGAFGIGIYVEQLINLCYGGFKIASGMLTGSAWLWSDGLYNALQGVIQLYQIIRHKWKSTRLQQWKAYRRCGYGMIAMNLTMMGLMFQMIHLGAHEETTEISIIMTATFTFYKLTMAVVHVAKDRKHESPVDSAVHFQNFGQALYNLFVLQVGLLWVFGEGTFAQQKLMNTLTGTAVCLLVLGMGFYMIWRARRDMNKEEESEIV